MSVLIINFMGLVPTKKAGKFTLSKDHFTATSKTREGAIKGFAKLSIYHKSWCWLMPVVQKCKEVKQHTLALTIRMDEIDDIMCHDLDVGKLHKKVKAFIELYNLTH